MVNFENFAITVKTPLRELAEFSYNDEEPPNTKTVYIEVPPENEPQTFVVDIKVINRKEWNVIGTKFSLSVDGAGKAGRRIFATDRDQKTTLDAIYIRSPESQIYSMREVSFAPIERTEDRNDLLDGLEDTIRKMGAIEVELRDYAARHTIPSSASLCGGEMPFEGKIHEKQLKGSDKTHKVKLGMELRKHEPTGLRRPKLPGRRILRFLYRSTSALQSLGLIPYPEPPVVPEPQPQPAATPTTTRGIKRERATSLSEINAQIKNLTELAARIKSEKNNVKKEVVDLDETETVPKRVKREREIVDLEAEGQKRVEVVDLT